MGFVENLNFLRNSAKIVKIGFTFDKVITDNVMSCYFYGPQCTTEDDNDDDDDVWYNRSLITEVRWR